MRQTLSLDASVSTHYTGEAPDRMEEFIQSVSNEGIAEDWLDHIRTKQVIPLSIRVRDK